MLSNLKLRSLLLPWNLQLEEQNVIKIDLAL